MDQVPEACDFTYLSIPNVVCSNETQSACTSELKLCGVCGDVAKSHHFGGLSCNSCKAFFRRSVHKDHYLKFECLSSRGHCVMTKVTRRNCQYCRMTQCFAIGMEKRWVMTDEQKRALVEARSAKKDSSTSGEPQQAALARNVSCCGDYKPQADKMTDYMTPREIKEIESVINKYVFAYKQVPYRAELRNFNNSRPGFQAMEMFGTLVRRFALYARLMPNFAGLPNQDQKILLKGGALEMCVLRGALVFDPVNNRWPNTDVPLYNDAPVLNLNDVTKMASSPVFQMHIEFIRFIKQLGADEATIMLLVLVVLFTDRPGLCSTGVVENCQIYYTSLLKRYLNWRFGLPKSQKVFNRLLTKLSDLRELSESHNQQNLHFDSDEISSIRNELQHLDINPYPEFNILNERNEPGDIYEAERKATAGKQTFDANIVCDNITSCEHTFSRNNAITDAWILGSSESAPSVVLPQEYMNSHVSSENDFGQSNLFLSKSPGSSNSNDASKQSHVTASTDSQNVPLTSLTDMSMQFMNTLDRTVNQALDEPHIVFEWTDPADFTADWYSHQQLIETLANIVQTTTSP